MTSEPVMRFWRKQNSASAGIRHDNQPVEEKEKGDIKWNPQSSFRTASITQKYFDCNLEIGSSLFPCAVKAYRGPWLSHMTHALPPSSNPSSNAYVIQNDPFIACLTAIMMQDVPVGCRSCPEGTIRKYMYDPRA